MGNNISKLNSQMYKGVVVAVIVWSLDLQLPMQSVPITTDGVSSNLDQGGIGVKQQSLIQSLNQGRCLRLCDKVCHFCPPIKLTATI